MPYLGIFGVDFLKANVIFDVSTLEFVKNKFLTHAVNFGIRTAFSKVLGSAFEVPSPVLDLLYEICRLHMI